VVTEKRSLRQLLTPVTPLPQQPPPMLALLAPKAHQQKAAEAATAA